MPQKNTSTTHPQVQIKNRGELRYLYMDSPWVQGVMSLKAPHVLVHDYAQRMMLWLLFDQQPTNIVQCGLGAGALTRLCEHHVRQAHVAVSAPNPGVIAAAHEQFFIRRPSKRIPIHQQRAEAFLSQSPHGHYGLLHVDAYGAEAAEPILGGLDFYAHWARRL